MIAILPTHACIPHHASMVIVAASSKANRAASVAPPRPSTATMMLPHNRYTIALRQRCAASAGAKVMLSPARAIGMD